MLRDERESERSASKVLQRRVAPRIKGRHTKATGVIMKKRKKGKNRSPPRKSKQAKERSTPGNNGAMIPYKGRIETPPNPNAN
ncbi:hypothetical protein SAMD00023353_4500820 [Rosellinia necatrix]|uniref:Uncharacterized protein n=1 Tax=Rosellinia necatrix TaxID=77044 RepID=A0A1S8A9T5_ROSNE|nr:hypothetical protein SAMD00023353_4500820 [Rosellinia necatrix]